MLRGSWRLFSHRHVLEMSKFAARTDPNLFPPNERERGEVVRGVKLLENAN